MVAIGLQLLRQAKCDLTSPTAGVCEGWSYHSFSIAMDIREHQNPLVVN